MRVTTVFALLLVSASAFNAPQFATRAVGKAPATKAVKKVAPKAVKKVKVVAKKVVAKKVAVKKVVAKKVAAKKVVVKKVVAKKAAPVKKAVAKAVKKVAVKKAAVVKVVNAKPKKAQKPPPASKGYPSFAAKAQNFKLGKGRISGGAAGKVIEPVFIHPIVNTDPVPDFDYKEAAKARKTPQQQETVFDDGLTVIERRQKKTLPAFLSGSARSRVKKSEIRTDINDDIYPFGLDGDRFQLLFISVFSLFTLVGALSGSVTLD